MKLVVLSPQKNADASMFAINAVTIFETSTYTKNVYLDDVSATNLFQFLLLRMRLSYYCYRYRHQISCG